tara:strand:+ start:387 stop:518 length:132 start_codon:yes stop_codon:yes gene_type:complete
MKRYFVEIGYHHTQISLYIMAYSEEQVRAMFAEYRVITVDITE